MKNEEILKENNVKRFDIILSNPPYNHGLHEKFLLKYFYISDKLITIQPVQWLLGQHQKRKITEKINQCSAEIETINGFEMFESAGIGGNISINNIDTTKKGNIKFNNKEYNKCEDISFTSNDEYISKFKKIIESIIKESVHDKLKATPDNPIMSMAKKKEYNPNKNWLTLEMPTIRGHVVTNNKSGKHDDFYTVFSKDDNFTINKKIKLVKDWPKYNKVENIGKENERNILSLIYLVFNTKEEAINFINYMKTDFGRTCLYIKKDGQNLASRALSLVPWFDFSDDHFSKSPREIDDWLFKKYNISDEIRKHIEKILPDYYNIR